MLQSIDDELNCEAPLQQEARLNWIPTGSILVR